MNADQLTDGKEAAGVSGMTVVGTDVYVAGYLNGIATYWQNGNAMSLNNMPGMITGLVAE